MAGAAACTAIKTLTTHCIDGAFVESHGREVMDIIKPTNGKVIARVTLANEDDTRRAVAAAKRAFATYGRSTKEERAELLRRLHAAASARVDELTAAMVEEYGGVVQFAGLIVQSGVTPREIQLSRDHSHPAVIGCTFPTPCVGADCNPLAQSSKKLATLHKGPGVPGDYI